MMNFFLYESNILEICQKQLTIIDSCAGIEKEEKFLLPTMESLLKTASFRVDYKKIFEEYIIECPNQEIILYSSQKGENSTDTEKGGLFIQSLLEVAKENKDYEVLNALKAFELAKEKVVVNSKYKQYPDYFAYPKSGKNYRFL